MASDSEKGNENRTICFCHDVSYRRIVECIRAGARTLYDIQAETCASTGCGGCEWDVREILERELAAKGGGTGG